MPLDIPLRSSHIAPHSLRRLFSFLSHPWRFASDDPEAVRHDYLNFKGKRVSTASQESLGHSWGVSRCLMACILKQQQTPSPQQSSPGHFMSESFQSHWRHLISIFGQTSVDYRQAGLFQPLHTVCYNSLVGPHALHRPLSGKDTGHCYYCNMCLLAVLSGRTRRSPQALPDCAPYALCLPWLHLLRLFLKHIFHLHPLPTRISGSIPQHSSGRGGDLCR